MKKLFTFLSRANNNSVGVSLFNHRRVFSIYSMLTIVAIMLMVPSAVRGQTTINFKDAALAAYYRQNFLDQNNPTQAAKYYGNIVMTDISYSGAGNNAKKGDHIAWRDNKTRPDVDISQLAFEVNTSGVGNAHNDGNGFYLRRESASGIGLYTGAQGSKIAVLNLKPGDQVTFNAVASSSNSPYGVGIRYCKEYDGNVWAHYGSSGNMKYANGDSWPNANTITIDSPGDLVVAVNQGVYITSIVIENGPRAEYEITTDNTTNTTTFQFTADGSLDINDYTIPSMQASFGNAKDYLMVSGLKAEMHKIPSWSESLETAGYNFQPSAGSFYEFRPTAGGIITVEGSLTGRVHLFVYDPTQGIDTWVQKQNNVFYKLNFPETNPQNLQEGTDYYDEHYHFENLSNGNVSFSFSVEKNKIYYICINNQSDEEKNGNYAFHLQKFSFTPTFNIPNYGKIVYLEEVQGDIISLVQVQGAGSAHVKVKRVSGNFTDMYLASLTNLQLDQFGWLSIPKPAFKEGTDNAGTIIFTIDSPNGDATFVVTFPYHASYDVTGDAKDPNRTYGHTWNFIDPRNSDSNIGNCRKWDNYSSFIPAGTTTGILSIGRYVDTNSTFHYEVLNREWTYSQRQTGSSGGFHDPYYANVWDMEGNNADMIWETEGLWFETGTNLSCIHNENDAVEDPFKTNPLNFTSPGTTDPDRYVGLLPVTDGKKSSFTIPGLMPGDRVLIFMKSGEATGDNGIFLNITGAKDALGKPIVSTDLYKAGGTNWQHSRYEGCYHFIKDDTTDEGSEYGRITFDMKAGSMCKLLYIRIYTGQRIPTNNIVSTGYKQDANGDDVYETDPETGELKKVQDAGRILFINEKGAQKGQYSNMSLRFRGKGQQQKTRVLTSSGNLNYSTTELKKNDTTNDSHFTVDGAYSQAVGYTSQVGEIGMFRMREMDVEYTEKYVADFSDRNFTVGYRDKVEYPYTWDFTDIKGFSQDALTNEADNYPIVAAAQDEYGKKTDEGISPWDISLFDASGNMKVNTGFDPITDNLIFAPHKIGFGNQLWAGDGVIPETRGLWFHSEDDSETGYTSEYSSSLYNDCLQITSEGISFVNVPDDASKRVAWWNYKMVVPDVPADGAVYMRMKRDTSVPDEAVTYSSISQGNVPFLAARFQFASQASKTDMVTGGEILNGESYSFFQVPGTTDEWIVAVKNTTGSVNHLTFTLNGWIVEKVAVSKDDKTLNKKGYASESRNRVIDHSLTSFFTGKPIKAYTAESYDAAASTIGLVEITKPMPAATTTAGQNVGSVLYNSDCADADDEDCGKVLDNKFNLFVPDMHDYKGDPNYPLGNPNITNSDMSSHAGELQSTTNNLMLSYNTGATSNATIPQKINDSSVYVLSYQYFEHDKDNLTENDINEAQVEAFYRVAKNGAGIKPNSAYLILPVTSSPAKVSFLFGDELFGEVNNGIATGITDALELDNGKLEWYSLDGRKLNGAPTAKGLYIVNGRKVLVK